MSERTIMFLIGFILFVVVIATIIGMVKLGT